ncbi:YbhB/YbcL family Raf kinase inhibitor-like protein [Candidatus Kaiserbacteria bacterium]|nr:YbhB/YbcL family Raf kinase inhibitor-like protein [Candidatus Kaiserbacteria bacterium]
MLTISSPAFADGASIPRAFTCDGQHNLSPALSIAGVPAEAQSLALIMDDPDIPQAAREARGIDAWDHWTLFDLPADTSEIPEGGLPAGVGTTGVNTNGTNAYTGPCPPPQFEPSEHRYIFTLYALDTTLELPGGSTKAQVLAVMEGHIIESARLVGRYKRIIR